MKIRLAAASLGVLLSSPLWAQRNDLDLFLFEKSYAALGTPKVLGAPSYYIGQEEPELLAEAQFMANFPLYRGLTGQEIADGTGRGFNLYISAQFRLRALSVQSGPVRSISFMPRFTGQYLWARTKDVAQPGIRHIGGLYAVLGHHSNGGDGCTFVDEVADRDGKCVSSLPPGTPASAREIRIRAGNFSTNYLEVGAAYRLGRVEDDPNEHFRWAIDTTLSTQSSHRIDFPLPGGAEPAFGDLYGIVRPRWDLHMHRLIGKTVAARVRVSAEVFFPPEARFAGSRDYRLETEALVQVPSQKSAQELWRRTLGMIAIGVRYVRGQDYYNTQFVRDIANIQFVFAVDPWTPWSTR